MHSRSYKRSYSRSKSRSRSRSRSKKYDKKRFSRSRSNSHSRKKNYSSKYSSSHQRSRSREKSRSNSPTAKTNFYDEKEVVRNRSEKEVQHFLQGHKIRILKGDPPKPIFQFDEIRFPSFIAKQIQLSGFVTPTPIQCQGWPILLQGNSLIGIAKTGSGKTLAYMIPAIIHLLSQKTPKRGEGPVILVLGPTRELVVQIFEETQKFTGGSQIKIACLYGGAEKFKQRKDLQYGCQIIVACPGRLLDFLEEGSIKLCRVSYLVLDEADRMLDMGFEPQIKKVVEYMKQKRQTVMCSATWPKEVQDLATEIFSNDAIHIQIGEADLNANEKITQEIVLVEDGDKLKILEKYLKSFKQPFHAIVFVKTKKGCDRLSKELRSRGYNTMAIHGDKTQNEREYVLDTFKRRRVNILVATDVAARGLDIKNITYVINYDFPVQIEDYVHRIGRTGRAGETGIAISFFAPENYGLSRELIKVLRDARQKVPEELYGLSSCSRRKNELYGKHYDRRNFFGSYGSQNSSLSLNKDWKTFPFSRRLHKNENGNTTSVPNPAYADNKVQTVINQQNMFKLANEQYGTLAPNQISGVNNLNKDVKEMSSRVHESMNGIHDFDKQIARQNIVYGVQLPQIAQTSTDTTKSPNQNH